MGLDVRAAPCTRPRSTTSPARGGWPSRRRSTASTSRTRAAWSALDRLRGSARACWRPSPAARSSCTATARSGCAAAYLEGCRLGFARCTPRSGRSAQGTSSRWRRACCATSRRSGSPTPRPRRTGRGPPLPRARRAQGPAAGRAARVRRHLRRPISCRAACDDRCAASSRRSAARAVRRRARRGRPGPRRVRLPDRRDALRASS